MNSSSFKSNSGNIKQLTKKKADNQFGGKQESQRQLRVAELISTSVINCLRKGKGLDIRLYNMPLTITRVKVSGDLRIANCYFVLFNTKLLLEDILAALEESRYVIRHYVTKEINLKYSPELNFFYDETFLNASIIEELLNKK